MVIYGDRGETSIQYTVQATTKVHVACNQYYDGNQYGQGNVICTLNPQISIPPQIYRTKSNRLDSNDFTVPSQSHELFINSPE